MTAPIDWTNPCQRFKALQDAYFKLISGGNTASIEYTAMGTSRKVSFSFANLNALRQELRTAEDLCAIANGAKVGPNNRSAIGAGSRRVWRWGNPFMENR